MNVTVWRLTRFFEGLRRFLGFHGAAELVFVRGLLKLHSRYGLQGRSPPKADFCPEASTRSVTRPSRSVATTSYRQLHGWILLPLVICAVGAHVESRKGARPG